LLGANRVCPTCCQCFPLSRRQPHKVPACPCPCQPSHLRLCYANLVWPNRCGTYWIFSPVKVKTTNRIISIVTTMETHVRSKSSRLTLPVDSLSSSPLVLCVVFRMVDWYVFLFCIRRDIFYETLTVHLVDPRDSCHVLRSAVDQEW